MDGATGLGDADVLGEVEEKRNYNIFLLIFLIYSPLMGFNLNGV